MKKILIFYFKFIKNFYFIEHNYKIVKLTTLSYVALKKKVNILQKKTLLLKPRLSEVLYINLFT